MKSLGNDWYQKIWSLDIQDLSWVEHTKQQVDFLIKRLDLKGNERVLDLACGFGRHSLELAKRGFCVFGVDLTKDYIDFASQIAQEKGLDAEFILSDIREVSFLCKGQYSAYGIFQKGCELIVMMKAYLIIPLRKNLKSGFQIKRG